MKKIYLLLFVNCLFFNTLLSQSEIWGLNPVGANGYGSIYGMPTGSTGIATEYTLSGNAGSSPQYTKLLQTTPNGKLYGMTNTGGFNNAGVIFEYDTATNVYVRKFDFGGTQGSSPRGALIQAQNGKLYGMTQLGGASNFGVIFEYDMSTNTYTKKIDLTGTTGAAPGSQPYGTLIDANPGSGKLYGMTRFGGANNLGVLFEYNYSTNIYTVMKDFDGSVGSALGANPFGQLTKVSGTSLYGMTSAGGTNSVGTIFEYDYSSGIFTKKVDLTATGSGPQGSLLLASNGNLYGMTFNGGSGTPSAAGVIFEYVIGSTSITPIFNFGSGAGLGANPIGDLIQATNGKLYGMTRLGGSANTGAVFEFNLTGLSYTKTVDLLNNTAVGSAPFGSLMQVSTGKIYGMTSNGGNTGGGVIFNYVASSATYTKKIDLNNSNGGYGYGHLIQASNGLIYGLASTGGTNNLGALFEYNKTTNTYTKKWDLGGATFGSTPFGSLLQASNGKLYGLNSAGGTSGLGSLFEYDITTNVYTKKVDFTGNAGTNPGSVPYGSLVQYSGNGKLYGMTKQGGGSTQGVIFEYDPSTSTYTKKIDLTAVNGYSAFGSMVESGGKLYGMTQLGGANSLGVIFEYDPSTNTYTKKIDFSGNTGTAPGAQPFGSMVTTATTGVLYGMTKLGGANGQGVIFEYNISTNAYTVKYDMSTANGSQPWGSLIRAANGNLYGVTNMGGANSLGALFEYNIGTSTYTKKFDFTNAGGNSPAYTQLLEVCTKPVTPGAISSSTNALCYGSSATANFSVSAVSNATSYAWTMPAGSSTVSGATSNIFAVNLAGVSAGTYTYGVAGVNICGTGTLSTASVSVHALPTVSVNSGSFCSGLNFTITPSGASTYTVQGGSFVVSPTSNTTYTVAGTSALGCLSSNTAVSSVTVNALPTIGVNSGQICLGGTFTIIPTGVVSSTVTGGSLIVSPSTNTTYAVIGTDANGCISSNTAISTVTVNPLPTISVNSGTICNGGSYTFTPTGAATYTIQGGSFVVSPPTSSSYTVMGTSSLNCVSAVPATGNVTVYALPVIGINSGTICSGQNHTFTPNGAASYTIQGGSFVVSPSSTTSYTIAGTSTAGCVSAPPAAIGTVTVYALPVIGINSGTICAGNSHTFVPTGGVSYTISGGSYVVSPSITTNYSVTGTSSLGCVSASPAIGTVTVYALPTVSVNSGTVCLGGTFTINPTGAGTGASYFVSPGGSTLVSPTVNSSYSVTATNSLGCNSAGPAISSVTVIALPVISSTSGAVCLGDVFTTTVSGAATYTYASTTNTINAAGSIPLNLTSSTTFSVYGTSAAGCQASSPSVMNVTVNPLPPVSVSGPTAICEGESATLTASGANSYNWGTSSNATIVVNPLTSTTYTVVGTDLNSCSQTVQYSLTVNVLPTITVISGAICPGNSFTLTPSGAATYTYSSGTNVVSPTSTTNYSVMGTSSLGCVSAQPAVATVSVVNILTVTISGNTNICIGSSASLTANGASTYSWNTGDVTNTVVLTPTASTMYTVIGASGTCDDTAFVSVIVNQLPVISAMASSSIICKNESTALTAAGAITYTWSTQQIGASIVVTPTVTSTYTVEGTDANGCLNSSSCVITVNECLGINKTSLSAKLMVYPNPNDGEFYIESAGSIEITIFNALGQPVLKQSIHEGKNEIDLKDVAKGIYFIKYKESNVDKTLKVVKQ